MSKRPRAWPDIHSGSWVLCGLAPCATFETRRVSRRPVSSNRIPAPAAATAYPHGAGDLPTAPKQSTHSHILKPNQVADFAPPPVLVLPESIPPIRVPIPESACLV